MESPGIKEIRINGLFGNINHSIPLNEGGITFIHGPNGCGKTTVLRLLSAIFNWETNVLIEVSFNSIEVEKNDGKILKVTKSSKIREKTKFPDVVFSLNDKSIKPYTLARDTIGQRNLFFDIDENLPFLTRVGPREWFDSNIGMKLDIQEVMFRYNDQISVHSKKRPDWLSDYINSVNLHFIKTQRLLKVDYSPNKRHRPEEGSVAEVIQIYSNEIKELINKRLAEQAAMSQIHDRSFPMRLISLSIKDAVSEAEIRKLYADTENKMQKLFEAGMIDKQENISLPTQSLEDTERRVLSLYLNDVNTKLAVFDDIQKKIEAFLSIINTKFKTKQFKINREDGFNITTDLNNPLQPTQLSSGEQHEIVLFYELIFKASDNSFFLIDEPEISLHVDWQRMFLDDIHKIAQLGDRYFLIATHSPQIIGSYRNLAVALNEGILDE